MPDASHSQHGLTLIGRSIFVSGVGVIAAALVVMIYGASAQARLGEGVHPIILPGLVYTGNASCAGSGCHSDDKPKEQSGQMIGDESNIWAEWDPHSHAYKSLKNDTSKAMAAKLNINDATQSVRCISCHSMDVPQGKRGDLFTIEDAAGCESCHGPGEKWLNPHAQAGWTAKQRAAIGAKGLLEQYGLIDTSNVAIRANTCVSCHLQIDKDLIDAGHPALEFEMYAYNYYLSKKGKEFYPHWNEPTGQMRDARLWAAGQAAARNAAKAQVEDWKKRGWDTADADALLKLYTGGAEIAAKHFGVDTVAGLAESKLTPEKCAAAAVDLAQLAPGAKDAMQRRVIAFGVAALGAAAFDGRGAAVPDDFWAAYGTATGGESGDAYNAAVSRMAELAGAK